ncbi:MAG: HAD family hydrolase [Alphaproteobacteria bacterium]|jgi:D-glycero-D-manno-heptose 1,7-bisphosphate phosphatase|nr:HAD family hydrolase [Alphaproteobacteria bacterium]MBP9877215.1 HAD family hydrolase [Alphaproteobacteria bacterium]
MHKALFLDRDGIINVDSGYVSTLSQFIFVDGLFSFLKKAISADYKLIIVTNQSGIARGYYTETDFLNLMKEVDVKMQEQGIQIEATYYCPYHPDGKVAGYAIEHFDRKPSPGMILRAIEEHQIDPLQSYIIGDHMRDIEAGHKAGLKGGFLVSSSSDMLEHKNKMDNFDFLRVDRLTDLLSFF